MRANLTNNSLFMVKIISLGRKAAAKPIINAGEFLMSNPPIRRIKLSLRKRIKIICIACTAFIAWLAVAQYILADKYEATVKVVEKGAQTGINPLTDKIDYGDLPKGKSSTRLLTIDNRGKTDVYVKIVKIGSIAELIKIDKDDFILRPQNQEKVEMSVKIPISADQPAYNGQVIILKMPKLF